MSESSILFHNVSLEMLLTEHSADRNFWQVIFCKFSALSVIFSVHLYLRSFVAIFTKPLLHTRRHFCPFPELSWTSLQIYKRRLAVYERHNTRTSRPHTGLPSFKPYRHLQSRAKRRKTCAPPSHVLFSLLPPRIFIFFAAMTSRRPTRACATRRASHHQSLGFNRNPGIMEQVDVLWVLHSTSVWWKADVLDISPEPSDAKGSVLGTIRYVARRNYNAEDYKVCFINPTSGLKKLQHLSPCTPGYVTWKFPEEVVSLSPSNIISRVKPVIEKKRTSTKQPHVPQVSPPSSSALRTDSKHSSTEEVPPTSSHVQLSPSKYVSQSQTNQSPLSHYMVTFLTSSLLCTVFNINTALRQ